MRLPVAVGLAARRSIRGFVVGGPSCRPKRGPLLVATCCFALLLFTHIFVLVAAWVSFLFAAFLCVSHILHNHSAKSFALLTKSTAMRRG